MRNPIAGIRYKTIYVTAGYQTFTTLYNTGVRSILDYGSEIWSYQNDKPGQDVQYRAIRQN